MIGFLIGLLTGGAIGVMIMALMNAASQQDRHIEDYPNAAETDAP